MFKNFLDISNIIFALGTIVLIIFIIKDLLKRKKIVFPVIFIAFILIILYVLYGYPYSIFG